MQMEFEDVAMPTFTGNLRQNVMELAEFRGVDGLTVSEVADFFGVHHGKASAALSHAHGGGRLMRLTERRDRHRVYVMPDAVGGRPTEPYGRMQAQARPRESVWKERAEMMAKENVKGRKQAALAILRFVVPLRSSILAQEGKVVKAHQAGCYARHPECALAAVEKALRNQIREYEERGTQ